MFQLSPVFYVSVLSIACCSLSQQFSPPVSYDAVLKSPINPNITISYKEPELGTCTTAFTSQKQYTGYINLPPSTLEPYQQNHPINTFFWFFEARNNTRTAPLTIWLNGGPGASSMRGLFREIGPCEVVQFQNGTYGTQFNEWGWDRSSNLLFIDQPTQVGFSYDQTHNVSVDFLKDHNVTPPAALPKGTPAWAYVNGTLASGNLNHIQNPTGIAARAVWHFLQGFLSAFPQYNPGQHPNQATVDPTGVNLFAESYGGQYGPVFADFFEDQNDRRRTGAIPANKTLEIRLASLGIVNGIVDELIQVPSTVSFAHNNSYGVRGLSSTQHRQLLYEFELPGGCQDLASQCNKEVVAQSHEGENVDEETEKLCQKAKAACWKIQWPALETIGRSPYDIRASKANSFPNYAYLEYLNSEDVLKSIGAKVNFTENTPAVNDAFGYTGDEARGTQIKKLVELLARGVRVAFIYGDADIICNWVGGEAVSLAVARESELYSSLFPSAGYADIISNASYIGGHVRQYGNLSFSRIFDAGHTVPSYQPETSFVVFSRIIQGDDIGSGRRIDLSTFGTQGPSESYFKNEVTEQAKSSCWIRAVHDTCTQAEKVQIFRGLGVVEHGKWFPRFDHSHMDRPIRDAQSRSFENTSSIAIASVPNASTTHAATSGVSRVSFHLHALRRGQDPPPGEVTYISVPTNGTKDEEDKDIQRGLTGGVAGAGGLLLLLTTLGIGVLGWRCYRSQPRRKSSPLPISEHIPTSPPQKKPSFVKKLVQRNSDPREVPSPTSPFEKPEEVPAFDRRPTRVPSAPMDPIPEAISPRPSGDIPERRLSKHPNDPVVVQRNARTPSPAPSVTPAVEHPKDHEPSPEPAPSPKPTTPSKESAIPAKHPKDHELSPKFVPLQKSTAPPTEPAAPEKHPKDHELSPKLVPLQKSAAPPTEPAAPEKHPKDHELSPKLVPLQKSAAPPKEPAAPESSKPGKPQTPAHESKPKTPEPEAEHTKPIQRSASFPSEEREPEAPPQTKPAPVSAFSEPDTSPKDKPSLLKRIRSIHQDNDAVKAKAPTQS